jgi:prophage regulatory protein
MPDSKLVRLSGLQQIVPASKTTIWRWIRAGDFPPSIAIGPRARAWDLDEILAWVAKRRTETSQPAR